MLPKYNGGAEDRFTFQKKEIRRKKEVIEPKHIQNPLVVKAQE